MPQWTAPVLPLRTSVPMTSFQDWAAPKLDSAVSLQSVRKRGSMGDSLILG